MGRITIDGVGKAYKRYSGKWARLQEWITGRPRHEKTWVLRDVSFRVEPGEAVGIVGMNGAGKSTLLKIITGTTEPTTGRVTLEGRVAALLELGMGFHPDFTGRQNALIAGQLLGYRVDEIAAVMDQIETFAEIGDYFDRPVRIYSSGMQVRLAFSVATAIRPDILIVDEALSVGDAYFGAKCFDRIRGFRKSGTTLLLVSHDKQAVLSICDRAVLLDGGRVAKEGDPESVLDFYNALLGDRGRATVAQRQLSDGRVATESGTGEAVVMEVALLDGNGHPVELVDVGAPVTLKVIVRANAALSELVLGYMIKDRLGQPVFGTNTHHLRRVVRSVSAGDEYEYLFRFRTALGPGSYSVSTALHRADTHVAHNYQWRDLALVFSVANLSQAPFVGNAWMPPAVEIESRRMARVEQDA